jgi:hypothetical protein
MLLKSRLNFCGHRGALNPRRRPCIDATATEIGRPQKMWTFTVLKRASS